MPDYVAIMRERHGIDAALTVLAETVGGAISRFGDWTAVTVRWLLRSAR